MAAAAVLLAGILHAATVDPPGGEEYQVYEAALAQLESQPNPELHVAIYERTLSGNCRSRADNPVLVKGCTFLWIKPQKPEDVEQMLRSHWRHFPKSAWKNFIQQNGTSVALREPIVTPWKHRLVSRATASGEGRDVSTGSGAAPEHAGQTADNAAWRRPDMMVFLSRVGFNSKHTDAIVYVLVFSYQDQTAVTGDYLRFRREVHKGVPTNWSLAGRVNYFSSAKGSVASAEPTPGADAGLSRPPLRLAAERK
jgi:hypothetical protein